MSKLTERRDVTSLATLDIRPFLDCLHSDRSRITVMSSLLRSEDEVIRQLER